MKKWTLTAALTLELASADSLSFSSIQKTNGQHLIQVLSINKGEVSYIDLSDTLKTQETSPFSLFKDKNFEEVQLKLSQIKSKPEKIAYSQLKSPLTFNKHHLCAGLNYSDHAAESGQKNELVLFPKWGEVAQQQTRIAYNPQSTLPELLDYEVELGIVFNRDIYKPEDIDKSIAALLLTNDFSDRAPQIFYYGDVENHESYSFTAAKSKNNYALISPVVVIPKDWKTFAQNLKMSLSVKGERKQSSSTSQMSLPIEEMLKLALSDTSQKKWPLLKDDGVNLDKQNEITLLPQTKNGQNYMPAGTLFMTGTPAGTLFQKPSATEIVKAIFNIPFIDSKIPNLSLKKKLKIALIENLATQGRYLKPNDEIESEIENLGSLRFSIVEQNKSVSQK